LSANSQLVEVWMRDLELGPKVGLSARAS